MKCAVVPRRAASLTLAAIGMALLCLASPASAQDALLDNAAAMLARHDSTGAYALLADAEAERAGDKRFDYLLGVAALDSGHITRAVFALERLVQAHPDDLLAHAELGRAYLAAGEPDSARAELREARSGSLPEGASAAIGRVLGVIDQVAPRSGPQVSGYLESGGGYDSNVNSATNVGQFAIPGFGGILFTNSPESRRHDDLFATAAGGVNAELALSPTWKLDAAANLRGNVNRVAHDMNTALLDATVGLRHTSGTQSETIALQNGTAWVGSALYRSANGASAQWQAQLDAVSQVSLFTQWSHQAYEGQSERDTERSVLGLGYARDFGAAGPLVYGSAYIAQEHARKAQSANFGHHAIGLRLGAEQRLGTQVVGFVEWLHEQRRYGGTEPIFEIGRRDRQDDLSAGLRYSAGGQWELLPQIHYTRGESNVVLYDYVRTVFQITARRSFQ
jgi:hypothetical protein